MDKSQKAFSDIYDKYIDKIYRFIFLKVNSPEIAEDLTSEAFLRGWQAFKSQKKEIKNIQAFLYQIARNLTTDHYREKGQAQFVSVEYASIANPDTSLEEKAMLTSDFEQVKEALVKIKEEYQEVIVWRYIDDLSVPEIAKMLNKSEEAVRVTIHRAMKALKAKLERV